MADADPGEEEMDTATTKVDAKKVPSATATALRERIMKCPLFQLVSTDHPAGRMIRTDV